MSKIESTSSQVCFENSSRFAQYMDSIDPLAKYREQFFFPTKDLSGSGEPCIYLAGNSLGLQPKRARTYIEEELADWAKLGVEGHFQARHPWLPYHEFVADMSARLVGALPSEVVVMNSLTVNLHLMLVSFYRPRKTKFKILIEAGAFPSDRYAVASHAKNHGYDPAEAIVELKPRAGESTLRTEDILETIDRIGNEVALVLLGQVNYLTGQAFEVQQIASKAQKKGCSIGLNLAHGAGNLYLQLHDWNVDFAVWCSYKYLNAGPGGIAGCFVHERHGRSFDLPRLEGWWGHNKETRFEMGPTFDPLPGAEGWQLSNPPIFQLAALRASLELFDEATMSEVRRKGDLLTGYLEFLLEKIPDNFATIVTPRDPRQRGSQLSIRVKGNAKALLAKVKEAGAICDFREPDIVRATPIPMYTTFTDVFKFAEILDTFAKEYKGSE